MRSAPASKPIYIALSAALMLVGTGCSSEPSKAASAGGEQQLAAPASPQPEVEESSTSSVSSSTISSNAADSTPGPSPSSTVAASTTSSTSSTVADTTAATNSVATATQTTSTSTSSSQATTTSVVEGATTVATTPIDPSSPALQGFVWPSDGPLGLSFQVIVHPVYRTERLHGGQDFKVPLGSSVVAARGGTVVVAEMLGGFGNTVVIDHGQGVQSRYAHLEEILVAVGDEPAAGELVARSGQTGSATGPVLHFQVLVDQSPIDPLLVLPDR